MVSRRIRTIISGTFIALSLPSAEIMRARTVQSNLRFVEIESGNERDNLWNDLESGYWREALPANHEHNVICGMLNRPDWLPILPRHYAIVEGLRWNNTDKRIDEAAHMPRSFNADMANLLEAADVFFARFHGKHIGVQLSGGVDSSLIIGLMKHLSVPYSLVGMTTNRYEFRTESFIQKKLRDGANKTILIDYEDHLPITRLNDVPPHQQPDLSACGYSSNMAMAQACTELGIEVLLTGAGGDVLLGTEVPANTFNWRTGIFHDTWMQDIVYAPQGVQVVPFFADRGVVECIWNMRKGQPEDPRKLWARKMFSDFLPRELVDYTFKGDFWGLYIDGLINNLPHLRKIHDLACELSNNHYFERSKLDELLSHDLCNCDQRLYQRIESRMSSAVWYVSLLS
jgi:hypothetical protein